MHKSVRDGEGWNADGKMFPAGLRYDCYKKMIEQYQTYLEGKPDESVRKKRDMMLSRAQLVFKKLFKNREVGWGDMIDFHERNFPELPL